MTEQDPNQGVLFYTHDEVEAKLAEANKELYAQVDIAKTSVRNICANAIAFVLKEELKAGTMAKEDVVELYERIASLADLPARAINSTYTVSVSYRNESIAEFSGIEAEDEDSAIEEVRDNLEVEVEVNFTLTHDGHSEYGTVTEAYGRAYEYDIDFEASEE